MKKFTKKVENFVCENCGKSVIGNGYTNHCPFCLYSKHVDIMPGDRLNDCHGLLKPIGIEKHKKTFKIIYRCQKCNIIHKNIMANDDNMDIIINLSQMN